MKNFLGYFRSMFSTGGATSGAVRHDTLAARQVPPAPMPGMDPDKARQEFDKSLKALSSRADALASLAASGAISHEEAYDELKSLWNNVNRFGKRLAPRERVRARTRVAVA